MTEIDAIATLDFDRARRCGFPEVVFGAGKTPEHVATIASKLVEVHGVVLVTRANREHAAALMAVEDDAAFVESCGILYIDRRDEPERIAGTTSGAILASGAGQGKVVVCCAGTSDLPVAEEAAITARIMGSQTSLLVDVGVAGVHRVLEQQELLESAHVLVVVAGMEGALPSLVAGLVDVPVVAVPTSIGYGANFGGVAALLGMLTSCAGGVSVVNIDNGFGAGQIAHRINAPRWLTPDATDFPASATLDAPASPASEMPGRK